MQAPATKWSMEHSKHNSVSVIIAAHNAQETIAKAVRSALEQSATAELCVIDDCSVDATAQAVESAAAGDPRCKVISLAKNAGPAAARNIGIKATQCDWIAVLDADDYFLNQRLEKTLAWADRADFIADDLLRVTPGGETRKAWNIAPDGMRAVGLDEFVRRNLGRDYDNLDLGFAKPLMRRAFLEGAALAYNEALRLGEDYELYARSLAAGARFVLAPAQGYVSVVRPNSLSSRHSIADLLALRDCDDCLLRLSAIGLREKQALALHRRSVDCRLQWRLLIDAVKRRSAVDAARTFKSSHVSLYLGARLLEAFAKRVGRCADLTPHISASA